MREFIFLTSGTVYLMTIIGLYGMLASYKIKMRSEDIPIYFMLAVVGAGLNFLFFFHIKIYFILSALMTLVCMIASLYETDEQILPKGQNFKDNVLLGLFCLAFMAIVVPLFGLVIYHKLDQKQ